MKNKQRLIKGREVSIKGLILNSLLCVFKITAGILGKSQAMIADGVHSLSDAGTDIIVILGLSIGAKPKDKTHPYGHGKFETVAAALIGFTLISVALKIGHNAIHSLQIKTFTTPSKMVIAVAIISIITKEWLYRYTISFGKQSGSLAVTANAWHHRSDVFSSVIVLLGVITARAGLPIFDPIAAMAVCFFILKVAFDIIKLSVMELVETSVDAETIKKIKKIAIHNEEVISAHGIKARKVGPEIYVELHIVLNPEMKLIDAHSIAQKVEDDIISQIDEINEVLIHLDPKK